MISMPGPMTILMLVIFAVMVGIASTYPPEARFMPFVVGIPGIGLCLLQFAIDLYRRRVPETGDGDHALTETERLARVSGGRVQFDMPSENAMFADTTQDERTTVRRELIVWGYFLGLIASVLLFGFHITVPIFLIAFLRFQAQASWRNALIYGAAGAVVMFVLFEKVLRVGLHNGFVTDFVLGRLGG